METPLKLSQSRILLCIRSTLMFPFFRDDLQNSLHYLMQLMPCIWNLRHLVRE